MIHLYQLRLLNSGGNYFIMVQEMTLWWYNYRRLCGIRQSRENAKMQKCTEHMLYTGARVPYIYRETTAMLPLLPAISVEP